MFKNRFLLVLGLLSLLLVSLALTSPISHDTNTGEAEVFEYSQSRPNPRAAIDIGVDTSWPPRPVPVTGAEDRLYVLDSATRSYIAWGQAMQVRNAMDSGTRSYIAWGEALEKAKLNVLDSGTRSYIAWGEALEAAGKLGESGACSATSQENIFAGIPNNLDSATRSYIAWGLALQAKDDIEACR